MGFHRGLWKYCWNDFTIIYVCLWKVNRKFRAGGFSYVCRGAGRGAPWGIFMQKEDRGAPRRGERSQYPMQKPRGEVRGERL